ncbi:MAG: glutathione S-transferase N-terminal domain-containing protein [Komarekiella atlantica HA4396-MV6]|jgi:glutathione S-transferase|nr:glutathione S-transferase N-terminal domain-containing protein [Komarekiella atlantica HA4396-MV6]
MKIAGRKQKHILRDQGHSMKLYHMPGACSLADLIVLEWIGVPHEIVRMSLESIKSPNYLTINADGTVPLLEHGDFSLTENVAILGYLADLYPEARLLGDGTPHDRAEVMRWLGFLNSDVHMTFKPIFTPTRFLQDQAFAGAIADTARIRVRTYLERLDARLDGRNWLTGERSIADPYLFVILRWAINTQVGLQGFENLSRFVDRMNLDAGVRTALATEAELKPS